MGVGDGSPAEGGAVMTPESAPYVEMVTSLGTIVIELYWQHAPRTCQVRRPRSVNHGVAGHSAAR